MTSCKIPGRVFAYLHILGHKSQGHAGILLWWCEAAQRHALLDARGGLPPVSRVVQHWLRRAEEAVDARCVSALLEESLFLDVTTQPSLALLLSNMSLLFRAFHRRLAKYGTSCSFYSREVGGLAWGRVCLCLGRRFLSDNF